MSVPMGTRLKNTNRISLIDFYSREVWKLGEFGVEERKVRGKDKSSETIDR